MYGAGGLPRRIKGADGPRYVDAEQKDRRPSLNDKRNNHGRHENYGHRRWVR